MDTLKHKMILIYLLFLTIWLKNYIFYMLNTALPWSIQYHGMSVTWHVEAVKITRSKYNIWMWNHIDATKYQSTLRKKGYTEEFLREMVTFAIKTYSSKRITREADLLLYAQKFTIKILRDKKKETTLTKLIIHNHSNLN